MSTPSDLTHWIALLADRERGRQAYIEAFQIAAQDFLPVLIRALQSDIDRFNQEFPDPRARATVSEIDHDKGVVTVRCSMYNPEAYATVRVLSPILSLTCEYSTDYPHEEWHTELELTNTNQLQWHDLTPQDSAVELAKKILRPVLFPLIESQP